MSVRARSRDFESALSAVFATLLTAAAVVHLPQDENVSIESESGVPNYAAGLPEAPAAIITTPTIGFQRADLQVPLPHLHLGCGPPQHAMRLCGSWLTCGLSECRWPRSNRSWAILSAQVSKNPNPPTCVVCACVCVCACARVCVVCGVCLCVGVCLTSLRVRPLARPPARLLPPLLEVSLNFGGGHPFFCLGFSDRASCRTANAR